jgi:hypothetical protein
MSSDRTTHGRPTAGNQTTGDDRQTAGDRQTADGRQTVYAVPAPAAMRLLGSLQ